MVYVPQLQDVRCVSLLVFAVQLCFFSTDVGWIVDCWWWSESSLIASSKVFISKKHRWTAMDPWLFLIESQLLTLLCWQYYCVFMSCFSDRKPNCGWLFDHSHFFKVIASCWGDYIFDDAFWDENGYHPQPAGCWIPEAPLPRHIFFWRFYDSCCSNRMVSERDEDWAKEFGTFLWMLSKGMIFWKMNLFPSESAWLPGFHCVRDLGFQPVDPPQR